MYIYHLILVPVHILVHVHISLDITVYSQSRVANVCGYYVLVFTCNKDHPPCRYMPNPTMCDTITKHKLKIIKLHA